MNVRAWSLRKRLLLASAALALLVGIAFLMMLNAMASLRDATEQERHSKDVMAATLRLQNLVVDLDTGIRGYIVTGEDVFLDPARLARARLPAALEDFMRLAAQEPGQEPRARRLRREILSYEQDHTRNVERLAREDPEVAASADATTAALLYLNEIRERFAEFLRVEDVRAAEAAAVAEDRARLAIGSGVTALAGTALLIALFGFYLATSIARPVRTVAEGAGRVAGGDLDVRLEEEGPGEIAELTRSFNRMAEALAHGRRELEAQYERVRESEHLKTELISIVSHELRTPLASMLGFTTLLLEREADEETRRRYLEIVNAQGRRLASLLDDFLNVQRLEEGRLEVRSEPVDVAAVLREQAQLYSAQSEQHSLELHLAEQHLPVRGDPNRLAQVVGNLLSNAIKYSPAGGRVDIVGEQDNGTVRISVRDEGLGIPEEQRDRIFTKFFRGDAAASGIAGSGLGLAFARAVVEAHGGRMSFTSETGKGSVFRVELPTHADGAAAAGEASAARGEGP